LAAAVAGEIPAEQNGDFLSEVLRKNSQIAPQVFAGEMGFLDGVHRFSCAPVRVSAQAEQLISSRRGDAHKTCAHPTRYDGLQATRRS
jgi:hypothetical protein